MAKQKPQKKPRKGKAKTGRPSEYKPKYDAMLIDHMASGLSYESFAGVVRKTKDTLYKWEKANPSFADAKRKGAALSLLWWEKMGITGMAGKMKGFNVVAWIFSMKNRHGYRNDPTVEKPPERSPELEDAMAILEREEAAKAAASPPPAPAPAPKKDDEP